MRVTRALAKFTKRDEHDDEEKDEKEDENRIAGTVSAVARGRGTRCGIVIIAGDTAAFAEFVVLTQMVHRSLYFHAATGVASTHVTVAEREKYGLQN
jgi:hypothetical protein